MAQQNSKPRLPLPPPLMMSEAGTFAHLTLIERWPTIIQRVIEENDFPISIQQNLESLGQELPNGLVRSLEPDQSPDLDLWQTYINPYQGQRWLDVPWYFAEVYLYRRILEATHYFIPGEWQGIDPFAPQKRSSLIKALPPIISMSEKINPLLSSAKSEQQRWKSSDLITLLYLSLWGNRIDLSLFPTDAGESERTRLETSSQQTHVLVDQTSVIADKISDYQGVRIDFILDNAGFELFCDLCLADFLLNQGIAHQVYLHLKPHPLFVSDAMMKDVDQTLQTLISNTHPHVQLIGHHLQNHLDHGRLIYRQDSFWTAPLPFWEMPESLNNELSTSQFIFVKGDANYRRLLGDCQWPFTTSFADIVCYCPAPIAALRTLKAELAAGLAPEQIETLNHQDPQWLSNGEWGVIQFVNRDVEEPN